MSVTKPTFTDEEFKKLTEYTTMTNSREYDLKRAEILGIKASGVSIAMGASVRIPLDQIAENAYIGLYSYVNGNVTIGKNVLIGPHCSVVAGNHKYDAATDFFSARTEGDGDDSIVIGDGCWLASNVTVTGGVKMGKCTLCCAGSVVTKSTEPYSIMAGIPAKKIGYIDPSTGKYNWIK